MATLALKAPVEFWGKASIPVHGGKAVEVDLLYAHMGRDALSAFIKDGERGDVATLMAIVRGWKPEQWDGAEFNQTSVEALCDQYMGAALAVYEAWLLALTQARRGN
jgi:Phage tail assembly chaperone